MKAPPKPSYFRQWNGPWRLVGGRWRRQFQCSEPLCGLQHRINGPVVEL